MMKGMEENSNILCSLTEEFQTNILYGKIEKNNRGEMNKRRD
jgi:hypothetical protein